MKLAAISESVLEALPQFVLQLFIVLLRFKVPTTLQLLAMSSSLATLSIAEIKKYIDNHIGTDLEIMDQMKNLAKYYPIFFLNATFRVTAATITVLFFRSFSLIVLILYSALLQRILNLNGNSKEIHNKTEFVQQVMESIFQSFMTNTNLENSKA